MPRNLSFVATVLTAMAALTIPSSTAAAAPAPNPVGQDDYCYGQCWDINPAGTNGFVSWNELVWQAIFGPGSINPSHSQDQKQKYENLTWDAPSLTRSTIGKDYLNSGFGVRSSDVESTISPRADVTIVRDKQYGVPHIYGSTRDGAMYGAGYAAAQDRLFLMDLLRHAGRGKLTSFAGGNPSNRATEQQAWQNAPYDEADYQTQYDRAPDLYGAAGTQLQRDVTNYIAGINAYIALIPNDTSKRPGEYQALFPDDLSYPQPFTRTDPIAIASLVGGIFGGGGGNEVTAAIALIAAKAKYGDTAGKAVFDALRAKEDPEAPTEVHNGASFPYPDTSASPAGTRIPDAGSMKPTTWVVDETGTSAKAAKPKVPVAKLDPDQFKPHGMSNAVVIGKNGSADGVPMAVFGPQTGYESPNLWLQEEIQAPTTSAGPGVSARGVGFAGINFSVQIGRGQDYSWSATSAGQDITDTYALPLCDPAGGPATIDSTGYLYGGVCTRIEVLSHRNVWKPSQADPTPAGSYTLRAERTKLGIITHRGTVAGKPVGFAKLRSTYFHEADSGIGFSLFNQPSAITSPQAFQQAAYKIGYAFNWHYVDRDHDAYFNSGSNPVRPYEADPDLPTDPAYSWKNWDPATWTASYTPFSEHAQTLDQDYLVSWNNKQAPGTHASDAQWGYGPVYRSDALERRVKAALANGGKLDQARLVKLMADAATEDLRAVTVLPLVLRVLKSQPISDPAVADAVSKLDAWVKAGGHRRDPVLDSTYRYDYSSAIQILDAWWPKLVEAEFRADMGDDLYNATKSALQLDDPSYNGEHHGSAWQQGWYGYVSKDLRKLLGDPVQAPLPKTYCGGSLTTCRDRLTTSLKTALAEPAGTTYPADSWCSAGDQYCRDQIAYGQFGGLKLPKMHWTNRPTYQQVVEFLGRRGDTNLARGRPATASSVEGSLSPSNAVDGNLSTRWGSGWSDPQWIKIDLGATKTIDGVRLTWEAAYGKAYQIQVSPDGTSWTTVYSTTTGAGGVEPIAFPATTARYIRMYGTQRGTVYGYSLYEFEVIGH